MSARHELYSLDAKDSGKLLQRIAQTYLEHATALRARVRAALDAGALATLEEGAHKLNCGSLTIGALRAGALVHGLEQASASNNAACSHALLTQIEAEFAAVQPLLTAELWCTRAAA